MELKDKIRFKFYSNKIFGKVFIRWNLYKLLQYRFRYEGTIGEVINNNMNKYLLDNEKNDIEIRACLTIDMVQCYYRYRAHPKEYFLFGFRDMADKRRSQFLTQRYKDEIMQEKAGGLNGPLRKFLEDKWTFYTYFKPFFKREAILVHTENDEQMFVEFCDCHEQIIIKPLKGQCGQGVQIIQTKSVDSTEKFREINQIKGGWMIEELIIQNQAMSSWNSSSVNTVRIPSFLNSTGFHVMKPFLRMGRKGAIIDNAAAGGIFAVIDAKTGVISTDGFDEFGHSYISHPDSNMSIRGEVIPNWSELMKTVEECHRLIPEHPYVGWDFALSDKGWVLVEGNWGQFLSEFADKEGIRKKFEKMFD